MWTAGRAGQAGFPQGLVPRCPPRRRTVHVGCLSHFPDAAFVFFLGQWSGDRHQTERLITLSFRPYDSVSCIGEIYTNTASDMIQAMGPQEKGRKVLWVFPSPYTPNSWIAINPHLVRVEPWPWGNLTCYSIEVFFFWHKNSKIFMFIIKTLGNVEKIQRIKYMLLCIYFLRRDSLCDIWKTYFLGSRTQNTLKTSNSV